MWYNSGTIHMNNNFNVSIIDKKKLDMVLQFQVLITTKKERKSGRKEFVVHQNKISQMGKKLKKYETKSNF